MENYFLGTKNLIGEEAFKSLFNTHVCIIGLGGVGSWAAETLARSGVQKMTLVDFDDICSSNINRQVQAHSKNIGKFKVDELATRLQLINPELKINAIKDFYTESSAEEILKDKPDYVIDAIDTLEHKFNLIKTCIDRRIEVVTTGAAGGKDNPNEIKTDDLGFTTNDMLLKRLKKRVRNHFNITKKTRLGIQAIYSNQITLRDENLPSSGIGCENGVGSLASTTAIFGHMAAWCVINKVRINELHQRSLSQTN